MDATYNVQVDAFSGRLREDSSHKMTYELSKVFVVSASSAEGAEKKALEEMWAYLDGLGISVSRLDAEAVEPGKALQLPRPTDRGSRG